MDQISGVSDVETISETTKWLRELIERKKNGKQVISPFTEERARQIMVSLEDISEDLDSVDTPAVIAVRNNLSRLKAEMSRRIQTDFKYAECREKLEKVSKDGFYLRFGDYFANAVGDLRKVAVEVSKEAKKMQKKARKRKGGELACPSSEAEAIELFLSQPWSEIDRILTDEENLLESSPKDPITPMSDLVQTLALTAKLFDRKSVRVAIAMYARRNDLVHRHLAELAKAGRYFTLASRIRDDLRALLLQKYITPEEKETTRVAILKLADRYFEKFKINEHKYEVMTFREWPMGKDGRPIRKKKLLD
ncbi:uncharacterized protein GGS22DRAFT_196462 [Annulohypoxylon maeteangense]|uniref:uncharacterized protein n=1 Tax=Annulohypoxylon maeteangense TaxID=1927788 RepID=UPI00200870E9|nr:uncharacterized protein GGS22DRAFT_196462 [Annulohypoxylon maeteangense]KAI0881531.1 hypothetical protein GGS22DRAFT_196462 [Annulohypoxylon maeteangense]